MRRRLLVVEDEPNLREYLVAILSESADAVGVETGEEAVALARTRPVDVALCDFMLPGLRGFDLVRELQGVSHPPTLILVTGYADQQLTSDALARGIFAVFGKPFDLQRLLDKIEEALRLRGNPAPAGGNGTRR